MDELIENMNRGGSSSEMISEVSTDRRLKRLSLLSKPLLSPSSPATSTLRRSFDELQTVEEPFEEISSFGDITNTPRASSAMGRERSKGIRSSISYATSPSASLRSPAQIGGRSEGSREWQGRVAEKGGSGGHSGISNEGLRAGLGLGDIDGGGSDKAKRSPGGHDVIGEKPSVEVRDTKAMKGVTLAEKHADLLTLIAQKERRVNELKLELAQQETALNALKHKWTIIATRTARPFTSQSSTSSSSSTSVTSHPRATDPSHMPSRRSVRPRPLTSTSATSIPSSSISSTASQSPTSPKSPPDPYSPLHLLADETDSALIGPGAQAVFNNLLATAYGPEGVVTPSAVEGGKRFWGQLVKTVSAAAAGNVPGNEGSVLSDSSEAPSGKPLDVASLKNMVSIPGWTSLVPTPSSAASSRPIRQPANYNRLPRNRDNATSPTSASTSTSPILNTPSLYGDQSRLGSPPLPGMKPGSGMSSFQDLMDLQEGPTGETSAGLEREASKELSIKGDEESDDGWGW